MATIIDKKIRKKICDYVKALELEDDVPVLELWTDAEDWDVEDDYEVQFVVGYVQGVADQSGSTVEDVLDECGLIDKDEDDDKEDEDEED